MADIIDLAGDRVTFREGQRLTARDLADDRANRARVRRLHVRHLHETWGIATGFDVQPAGPAAVAVGPGHAIDSSARDLLLSSSLVVPVPAAKGPQLFVLVATYLADCAFPAEAARAGACLTSPLHPRRERAAFAWRTPTDLEPGPMVPICHVVVENGAIQGSVGTRVRRYARRLVRPFMASGRTDVPSDAWSDWWHANGFYGQEQHVDTSDAGFTATPQYFAQLVPMKPSPGHTDAEVLAALAGAHGHIRSPARDGFEFRAVVRENFMRDLTQTWAVAWVGVQPMAGCPPALNLRLLVTLAGHFFKMTP
jgi:hypothetical protein